MQLAKASKIALQLVDQLSPYCDRVSVAGSIRRQKPEVHDIDIVAMLNEDKLMKGGYWDQRSLVPCLADPRAAAIGLNGPRIASFKYQSAQVDLYWATTETWATLLLIRTGSKEHNIKLCTLAKRRGFHLHASGDGLFRNGTRIAWESEQDIFRALDTPYIEPQKRG